MGYSRAVVAGRHVYVSGTAPIPPDDSDPPEDVVRTRLYVVDADEFDDVGRAHGEVFGEIRPATTGIVVKSLLDPRWRVEVEADAVLREDGA